MVPFINNINDEERRNDNIPLDVYFFYDKNMFERKKTFRHSKIQNSATFRRIIEFRNYLPSVNLLLSRDFQKQPFADVFQNRCS